jgi:hypothetical protein
MAVVRSPTSEEVTVGTTLNPVANTRYLFGGDGEMPGDTLREFATSLQGQTLTPTAYPAYAPYAANMMGGYAGRSDTQTQSNDIAAFQQGWAVAPASEVPRIAASAGQQYDIHPHDDPNYVYFRYWTPAQYTAAGLPVPAGAGGSGGSEGGGEGGGGEGGGAPEIDIAAMMAAALQYGTGAAEWNLANYPAVGRAASDEAVRASGLIDRTTQERTEAQFPGVTASMQDMFSQYAEITAAMQRGELPQDVIDRIADYAVEFGGVRGTPEQLVGYGTARNLGRTSLDVMAQGQAYAQQFPEMIGRAQSVFMPGTMNLSQLYSQNLSNITPYAMLNPNVFSQGVFGMAQTNANNATQMAGYNNAYSIAQLQADTQMAINAANNAFSNYWNQQQQLWATQNRGIEQAANAQAQQSAQRNSLLNAGVGIIGAIAGAYTGGVGSAVVGGLWGAYQNRYSDSGSNQLTRSPNGLSSYFGQNSGGNQLQRNSQTGLSYYFQ